jgi:class 3 adenylate cyclase
MGIFSFGNKTSEADTDLLNKKITEMTRTDYRLENTDRLRDMILNSKDADLFRINVKKLAVAWQTDYKPLIPLFLWSAKTGLMDLHWDIHCPQCNGLTSHHHDMDHLTGQDHCPRCKMDFECTIDGGVEVSFTVNSNVRKIKTPDPMSIPNEPANQRLNGFEVINSPIFRKFFSKDLLSEKESVKVQHVAIMFTDLKGSTQMYQDLGDPRAFKIVKDHFEVAEKVIQEYSGVIVKTIGDAIMASFGRTSEAIEAAIAIQNEFHKFNENLKLNNGISLRIGIHVGPSLVVTLNNRLDYFGTMVNVAARVEALGDGKEIIITKEVFDDLGVRHALLDQAKSVEPFTAKLKGIDEEQKAFRIVY